MLSELHLPRLIERIHSNVTYFTVKCLNFLHLSPHYSQVIRTSLQPATRWLRSSKLSHLSCNVWTSMFLWQTYSFRLHPGCCQSWQFTTCKVHPPVLQTHLALDAIATISYTTNTPHHIYTDGSVQVDGTARCNLFTPAPHSVNCTTY